MSYTTYHEFDHDGKHYRLVYDDDYQVDRACGGTDKCDRAMHKGESEEDCDRYYQEELDKLESGEWVALGCITTRPCPGENETKRHCVACSGTEEIESVWGIVVENSNAEAERVCKAEC